MKLIFNLARIDPYILHHRFRMNEFIFTICTDLKSVNFGYMSVQAFTFSPLSYWKAYKLIKL